MAAAPLLSLDLAASPPPLISFAGAVGAVVSALSPGSRHGACGGMETHMRGRSTCSLGRGHQRSCGEMCPLLVVWSSGGRNILRWWPANTHNRWTTTYNNGCLAFAAAGLTVASVDG